MIYNFIKEKIFIIALVFIFFFVIFQEKVLAGELIMPSDLEYKGAFLVPVSPSGGSYSYQYGLNTITYYKLGDPGNDDEYTGSLFADNHTYEKFIGEFSIPEPIISESKSINDLSRATQLQDLFDVNQGLWNVSYPVFEMLYLDGQGEQEKGKFHFAVSSWYNVSVSSIDVYGWFDADLSQYSTQGTWKLGDVDPRTVGEYMLEVPESWANEYVDGKILGVGMDREGPTIAGPALHLYAPWQQGNPPQSDTVLEVKTVLKYTSADKTKLNNASVRDEWGGAAWLVSGSSSSVVFFGKKGFGESYYGTSNEGCNNKGYHVSEGFRPYALFYDPDDFAAVASGTMSPGEPQPYATFDFAEYVFVPWAQCGGGFKAVAYNKNDNILYLLEGGDSSRGIIHVFKIKNGRDDFVVIRHDVNQDSQINTTDAMLTLRNSLGLDMSQTNWQSSAPTGNVNCDETSNSTDAMLILRYSLGLDMSGTDWCEI